MEDPFKIDEDDGGKPRMKKSSFLLEIDAWIDSYLYESRYAAGEMWEEIVIFFRRFRVRGLKRLFFEAAGEGMTLGAAGMVLMLALALPASEEIAGNWREQDEFAVTFLDRYGNEIGKRGILHTDAVPVEELPDHLVKAVLATEDRRFFEHYGLDFVGLARAMTENARAGSVVQGGSTITQQLAKNLFLSNERTLDRKIKEAFLSLWLEANLTKEEILKLYLDRAYMGGGTFGVAAAAEFYFDKDVRNVTLAESAMLAGLFKAPAKYAPHINLPAARARANEVLTNMVQGNFMTEGQVTGARRNPADVVLRDYADSPDYFLDWAFEEVKKFVLEHRLPNRSLTVRTTIDLDLQRAAEEAVLFFLRQYGEQYNVTESAVVLIENNGAVRAMVGGRDYGESQFNRATVAERQAGSSFKPYVYAAALEQTDLTPESVVRDGPITWRGWSPKNYSRGYSGSVTLATALAKSINTVPVLLARDYLKGTEPIVELTKRMGITSPIIKHHTMVLGTSGITVLDQATGYLTFASGGYAQRRHAFTQIIGAGGEILFSRGDSEYEGERVLSEETAIEMNRMLANVPKWGTGRRADLTMTTAAGKTGTTQSYRDAWFVGYTGNFTAAVWYGNDNYEPTNRLTGGNLPAMTWQRIMTYAHNGIELRPIPGVPQPEITPEDGAGGDAVAEGGDDRQERPRVLSRATAQFLRELGEMLESAKPLNVDRLTVAGTGSR
ncbi:transglycosylase domain-containing protein [Oricola thermophila]|uniref:PBP1A family penicillin-binding protein n=1 Tax=Oricola thermophila TaxID=2742145 RepID=A0A6N1VCP3_9HYPH|nr:PBP1A family penicillin-binding protein [Oricola thermophila]QKV18660.1 PBP1A family penicillin-binding protein [Oricola thermophila]